MKLIVAALLLAALALPTAAAWQPTGEKTVGPCTYSYNWWWPGSYTYLTCAVEGEEVVGYGSWETWAGPDCELRVLGDKVYGCDEQ